MTDKFNTFAGWALFAGIIALGLSILSGMYFGADKHHEPDVFGFPIEGGEEEGGADSGPSLAALLSTGDAAAGEKVFSKCVACHTIEQGGATGIGPNLFGVVGTAIGSHAPGFDYSGALKDHGGNWDFENLDAWLKSPRAFANGTKMSFAGLSSAEDRANLLVYLNAMGSNLPLPAVEEAPAEEAAPAEGEEVAAEEAGEAGVEAEAGAAEEPVAAE